MGNFLNCQAVRVSRVLREISTPNERPVVSPVTWGPPVGTLALDVMSSDHSALSLSAWVFLSINSEITFYKFWNLGPTFIDWNVHGCFENYTDIKRINSLFSSEKNWNPILFNFICSYDTSNKSTKGASKQRRDSINHEINKLRDLLPIPASARFVCRNIYLDQPFIIFLPGNVCHNSSWWLSSWFTSEKQTTSKNVSVFTQN